VVGAYDAGTAHCAVSETLLVQGGDHNFTASAAAEEVVGAAAAFVARGVSEMKA
jgi:hypothetical protein